MRLMKLLIESAMIFFGTLMAAGLVALGEPAAGSRTTQEPQPMQVVTNTVDSSQWAGTASAPGALGR
jgi:hypothetical protein